jgi:copper chaperone CopZ
MFILLVFSFFIAVACGSENSKITQTANFKVFGNCEMCKDRIESSLKEQKGVASAVWNVDNKMLKVEYDSTVTINELHKKIASVGHDTEIMTAQDDTYKSLHVCCQYKRK